MKKLVEIESHIKKRKKHLKMMLLCIKEISRDARMEKDDILLFILKKDKDVIISRISEIKMMEKVLLAHKCFNFSFLSPIFA